MFPKIGVFPPKSSILIGCSIIFTIHFGGFPPIFGCCSKYPMRLAWPHCLDPLPVALGRSCQSPAPASDVTHRVDRFFLVTRPETNSSHLEIDPWKRTFLLETTIFRCYVSFREGRIIFRTFKPLCCLELGHNLFEALKIDLQNLRNIGKAGEAVKEYMPFGCSFEEKSSTKPLWSELIFTDSSSCCFYSMEFLSAKNQWILQNQCCKCQDSGGSHQESYEYLKVRIILYGPNRAYHPSLKYQKRFGTEKK